MSKIITNEKEELKNSNDETEQNLDNPSNNDVTNAEESNQDQSKNRGKKAKYETFDHCVKRYGKWYKPGDKVPV